MFELKVNKYTNKMKLGKKKERPYFPNRLFDVCVLVEIKHIRSESTTETKRNFNRIKTYFYPEKLWNLQILLFNDLNYYYFFFHTKLFGNDQNIASEERWLFNTLKMNVYENIQCKYFLALFNYALFLWEWKW